MKSTLKQIEAAAKSLKLKLPFTPECDPAHDLIDRIILLCAESATDRALDMLRARYDHVESARVLQYEKDGTWLSIGIPKHQPFIQQIEWCERKGVTALDVTMAINGGGKFSNLTETFNINDFK